MGAIYEFCHGHVSKPCGKKGKGGLMVVTNLGGTVIYLPCH